MTNHEAVLLLRKANKLLRKFSAAKIRIIAQEINNDVDENTTDWTDMEILIWHLKKLPKEEEYKNE